MQSMTKWLKGNSSPRRMGRMGTRSLILWGALNWQTLLDSQYALARFSISGNQKLMRIRCRDDFKLPRREHHAPSQARLEFVGQAFTTVWTSDPTKSRDDKVIPYLWRNPSYPVSRIAKMVSMMDMTAVPQQRKQYPLPHPVPKR